MGLQTVRRGHCPTHPLSTTSTTRPTHCSTHPLSTTPTLRPSTVRPTTARDTYCPSPTPTAPTTEDRPPDNVGGWEYAHVCVSETRVSNPDSMITPNNEHLPVHGSE